MSARVKSQHAESPFTRAARAYFKKNWSVTPADIGGRKGVPARGVTGHHGQPASERVVVGWRRKYAETSVNIGIVMPPDVIAVDVDYKVHDDGTVVDGAPVWKQLARFLPPTFTNGHGDPGSIYRHSLFRVPEGVSKEEVGRLNNPGTGVDIIRWNWRWLRVGPSVHASGEVYYWLDSDGKPCKAPRPSDLPQLTSEQWDRLVEIAGVSSGAGAIRAADVDTEQWLVKVIQRDGDDPEWSEEVRAAFGRWESAGTGQRHDSATGVAFQLARLAEERSPGAGEALTQLGEEFVAAVGKERDGEAEWERILDSAVGKAVATTQDDLAGVLTLPNGETVTIYSPGAYQGTQSGSGASEQSIGERFPVLGLDLLDPNRPPRRWFLDGVVPEGDHVSIVAPGGTGKSLLALALSIAAVRGESVFIGRAVRLSAGAKVLYVDKENSEDDWRERLLSLGVTMENAAEFWGTTFIPLPFPPFAGLDTAKGAAEFFEVLDHYGIGKGDVVVLDSTQRVTEGEENSNDTMRAFYLKVGEELKRRGITVIRTDNTGKDTERGARGASAKADDIGYSWLLERRGRTDVFTLKNTKFRGLGNGEEVKYRVLVGGDRTTFSQMIEPATLPGGMSGLDHWYHDHFRVAVMDVLRRVHDGAGQEGSEKSNLITQSQLLRLVRAEAFDYYDAAADKTEKKRVAFSQRKGIEWLGELAAQKYVRVEGGEEVTSKEGVLRVSTKYYGWRRDLPEPISYDDEEEVPGDDEAAC